MRAGLNVLVAGGTQAGNPTNRKDTPWLPARQVRASRLVFEG